MVALTVALVLVLIWSALSRPLDGRGITSALFLAATGIVAALVAPEVFDVSLEAQEAEQLAEVALVLLLFSDATRLDLHTLRREIGWPTRLLLIGLPLTLLAGVGVGMLVFPDMALASVVLVAIMLTPTDAALGQKVVADEQVPARVRQALDVESGLNDGLAVPIFLVALSIANAELEGGVAGALTGSMLAQIGWGLVGGVVAGAVGGVLFRVADARDWIATEWRQILPLAGAVLAFSTSAALGGSAFIAAFVGGIVFGLIAGPARTTLSVLTEEAGELLAAITWIAFGALAFTLAIPHITWRTVVYAVLSLTVVRMVPVLIAFLGQGLRLPTVAFIGWFGPRGLASLVFVLIAAERGVPQGETVLTVVTVTIALSILLHGLTSVPLVAAYHRWYEDHRASVPSAEEAVLTQVPRVRRQLARLRSSTHWTAGHRDDSAAGG